MEKLATDIYTFEKLVKNGFTYIDKTDRLWPLVNLSIGSQFFIARPRRFGKSLTISVLQALFEGKRELFKGLFIEPLWDWSKRWPVLRIRSPGVQSSHGRFRIDGARRTMTRTATQIPFDFCGESR